MEIEATYLQNKRMRSKKIVFYAMDRDSHRPGRRQQQQRIKIRVKNRVEEFMIEKKRKTSADVHMQDYNCTRVIENCTAPGRRKSTDESHASFLPHI